MKSLKLSIAILTYNRASCLKVCLESIIDQLNDDVEIVISDNASSDNTCEIVNDFKKRADVVSYFRSDKNNGFDRNVLSALEHSKGEYVWLMGDDDILLPGAVEKVLKTLNENEALSLIYANYTVYDKNLINILQKSVINIDHDTLMSNENECLSVIGNNLTFVSALVMNRSLCLNVAGIEKRLGFGFVQLYIVLNILIGHKSYYIAKPLVGQRSGNSLLNLNDFIKSFVVEVSEILNIMRSRGYANSVIRKTINKVIKEFIVKKIFHTKKNAPESLHGTLKYLIRYYYKYPLFWIDVFPFYLLPSPVLKIIWQLYRITSKSVPD